MHGLAQYCLLWTSVTFLYLNLSLLVCTLVNWCWKIVWVCLTICKIGAERVKSIQIPPGKSEIELGPNIQLFFSNSWHFFAGWRIIPTYVRTDNCYYGYTYWWVSKNGKFMLNITLFLNEPKVLSLLTVESTVTESIR